MDVTFEFTRDDYWELNKLVIKRRTAVRRPRRRPSWQLLGVLGMVFVVLFAVYAGLVVTTDGWDALGAELGAIATSWLGWVIGGLLLVIVLLLLVLVVLLGALKLLLPRMTKQLVSEQGSLLGRHHVTIEDAGVRLETPKASGFYAWSGVVDVVDEPAAVVLFVDTAAGVVIPKRAFADEAAAGAFLAEVRARWEAGRQASAEPPSPTPSVGADQSPAA